MKIAGFQLLSLIDYPGVVASIVFTQGCVFRCPYCHNPELIPTVSTTPTIDPDTIFASIDAHRNMIEGVCVTGGEPTLQSDLAEFLRKLKQRGLLVKLDTNGVHPDIVEKLIDAKLADYFAMDLKHLWERYRDVIQINQERVVENCRRTFQLIQDSGVAHEFRTTVAPALHTENDLIAMAGYLKHGESYALQAVHYNKMLDPNLPHGEIDLQRVANKIRSIYPSLAIEIRI